MDLSIGKYQKKKIILDSKIFRSNNSLHRNTYVSNDPHLTLDIKELDKVKRISGYFQNYENIKLVAQKLNSNLKDVPLQDNLAIHVRRGDYMKPGREIHGLLGEKYYGEAINYFQRKYGEKQILIYSDSPQLIQQEKWVNSLLMNGAKLIELIDTWSTFNSLSKNNYIICANSTFSWWASVVGTKEMIILPKQWYRDKLIPSGLTIPNCHIV